MQSQIQVSILSPSRLYREAVAACLRPEDGFAPVSAAATPQELFRMTQTRPVDVLLVHCESGTEEAEETVGRAKSLFGGARVVVLGCPQDADAAMRCVEAGAVACLGEDATYASLVETIRAVQRGEAVFAPQVLSRLLLRVGELAGAARNAADQESGPLSGREEQVARMAASGLPNKLIARRLGVRLPTVKTHVQAVMRKLQIKRRRDLIRWAYERGTWEEG